jgi:hypothetical protein
MMYEQQIKALIAKAVAEAKQIEGEIVHVAKSDFDALVTRVDTLEQLVAKDIKVVVAGVDLAAKTEITAVIADVTKAAQGGAQAAQNAATEVKTNVEKL